VAVRRTLVIVRHAKSEWPDGVPDNQRPLAGRGRKDAVALGRWLRDHLGRVDLAICSPAARARQTWELAAAQLRPVPRLVEDERVYAASADDLRDVVEHLPEDARTVVLVGHNPGLQDLVELLSGELAELKTAAVAVLSWPGTWVDLRPGKVDLDARAKPRH